VILIGGDKQGTDKRRFYDWLIRNADERFDDHLWKKKEEDGR
jgi:hypothetical protein